MADIPEPDCPLGYTDDQVKAIVGEHLQDFADWMIGQTTSLCDGTAYSYELDRYYKTDCYDQPHGPITYVGDLKRFLAQKGL